MIAGQHPLVSIVTPSYNQGRFIEETILSVKNQDYPHIEHVIIDGASSDNTVDILRGYEGTYNMRWVSEADGGHADGVNKGFRMAKGEIIGWLNSDDMYADRGAVGAAVEAFQRRPGADVVYGDIVFVTEDDTILRVQCSPGFSYRRLLQWCFLEQPAVFLRRGVTEAHQLDAGMKVALDYEYLLRIGKECRFYHLSRVLAADRNHSQRISVARAEELREVSVQLREQYGQKNDLWHYLTRSADVVFSGLPRRVKGLLVLVMLRRKKDWAFPAKFDGLWAATGRQLWARSLTTLVIRR